MSGALIASGPGRSAATPVSGRQVLTPITGKSCKIAPRAVQAFRPIHAAGADGPGIWRGGGG